MVTVPVPKFTCDPFGNTVALPTIVGSPVSVFILFPVTEYIDANVGVPVFKFTLDPVNSYYRFCNDGWISTRYVDTATCNLIH